MERLFKVYEDETLVFGADPITDPKNLGRNLSSRSSEVAQSRCCFSVRKSGSDGGTSNPAAFMTRMTFFSVSGMASY